MLPMIMQMKKISQLFQKLMKMLYLIPPTGNCSQYPDIVIAEHDNKDEYAPVIQNGDQRDPARESLNSGNDGTNPLISCAIQKDRSSTLTTEDPVTMMDSILNENINFWEKFS
jgi:heat shock transcription factor 2